MEKVFPQKLDNDNGKIHRLNDDGTVPADNPFKNSDHPSIYSYGQRNPQGLTTNPWTGDIWETEHGPRGGDEINIIQAGKNSKLNSKLMLMLSLPNHLISNDRYLA